MHSCQTAKVEGHVNLLLSGLKTYDNGKAPFQGREYGESAFFAEWLSTFNNNGRIFNV
eukprot:m.87491 g.87491  ORF g.87491 m.87491 type:complete len:58 (+) comp8790_c0_seq2:87-260(+)